MVIKQKLHAKTSLQDSLEMIEKIEMICGGVTLTKAKQLHVR